MTNWALADGPGLDREESRTIPSESSQHTDQCSTSQELLLSGANNGASLMQGTLTTAPGIFL
jgi:hypothetical protein